MKYILYILLYIFSSLFQSVCLHIATKKYLDSNIHITLIDLINDQYFISYQILDILSLLPLIIFIIINIIAYIYNQDISNIFNKTLLIASILGISKGIFDMVTIIPDSSGYDRCLVRLGLTTKKFLDNLDFNNKLFISVKNLLIAEIFGLNGKRMRYCSDMILSGHTFYVVLFNISSYNILSKIINNIFLNIIKIILISITLFDISCILISKFHYTIDVLISIFMVIILYDSRSRKVYKTVINDK